LFLFKDFNFIETAFVFLFIVPCVALLSCWNSIQLTCIQSIPKDVGKVADNMCRLDSHRLPEKKPRIPQFLFTFGLPFGGANVCQKLLLKKGLGN